MQISVTKDLIIDFIFNAVNEEQHRQITNAINTDTVIKDLYLHEKRKYDIEWFLDEEMSLGERCEIEELLKINEYLYEHFELSKDVNEFLKIEVFNEQLNKVHNELYNPDQINETENLNNNISLVKEITPVRKLKHNILRIGKWVAAASIILLIGFSAVNMYLSNRDSLENRLYAKFYEPHYDDDFSLLNSSYLTEAKNKYYNKDYKIALFILENLPNSLSIKDEKLLYQGLSLMELGQYKEAIVTFKKLDDNKNYDVIKSVTNWYLGLCYLKTKQRNEAIKTFNLIVENNGYNCKEAEKILKKL